MGQFTRVKGYSGLLLQDDRIDSEALTASESSYTESGPTPGQAVPGSSTTKAIMRTHGTQGNTTYNARATRGGYGSDSGFSWSQVTAGVETARRGWNSPNLTQDLLFIGGGVSTDEAAGRPACVTLSSGRMVWFYVLDNSAHSPATYAVCCTYTDLFTVGDVVGTDASQVIIHDDPEDVYYPPETYYGVTPDGLDCVCARWDDERLVIQLFVRVVAPVSGELQFALFESPDAVTWTAVQLKCCDAAFIEVNQMQAPSVAKNGGITTIIQMDTLSADLKLNQFVSYDNGQNFTRPYGSVTSTYAEVALCEHLGTVVAAARVYAGSAVHTGVLASLADDFTLAVLTDMESPATGYGISLCSQNGLVWLACTDIDGLDVVMRSSKTGRYDNWLALGYNPLSFESTASGVSSEYVRIQPGLGGLILTLCPTGSNVPDELADHLIAIRCGGWASVTMPAASDDATAAARMGFGPISGIGSDPIAASVYYPICLPEELDRGGSAIWTYSSLGSPASPTVSSSLAAGVRLRAVLTAAGSNKYHDWVSDFDGDIDTGVTVYFDGHVTAGTNNDTAISVYVFDGSQVWGCVLRFGPGSSAIFADYGGTNSDTLDDVTTRYQYIIAIRRALPGDTNAVANLYRSTNVTISDRFGWALVGTVACTPSASATAAMVRLQVHHGGDGAATYTSSLHVYALHYRAYCGTYLLDDLATQPAIGDYLHGAPAVSSPIELSDGFKVSFTGGALRTGDTWTVAPRYTYAKEHLDPCLYPSPRHEWRSQGDDIEMTFAWTFNGDDAPEGLESTSLAIMLQGINFPEFVVEGHSPGGTWDTLIDVSTYSEFSSLEYVAGTFGGATGPFMQPASSTTSAARFIHENELAGGTVNIDIGGGSFRKVRIVKNTSGYWSSSNTAGKKCRLFLDPNDWDAAIPSSGTFDIWPPRVLAMKHGLGTFVYRKIRLVIAANQTATDDYRIGAMVIGPLYVFGKNYSFGRKMTRSANVTVTTQLGGGKNAVVNGPSMGSVEFGWFEGVDSQPLHLTAEDDYVALSDDTGTAHAAAARHDIATGLDGLYDRINGAECPLVYVAKIPFSDDPLVATVVTDPGYFMYGRIMGAIERSTIRGEEGVDEVTTVGPITVEEEV